MTSRRAAGRWKPLGLAGAAGLALVAAAAAAQNPSPPPAAAAPEAAAPAGAEQDKAAPPTVALPLPPLKQLTPAQKLAASLPAPQKDFGSPLITLEPDGPLPSAAPRDLEGDWSHDTPLLFRIETDHYGEPLPYTMAGAKVLERRVLSLSKGKPYVNASSICRPPGLQWQHDLSLPFQIIQTKNYIEIVFQEYHSRWYIVMNRAFAPPPAEKQYMGYSVGRWEGNTLVVETSNHKDPLWLDVDGTPMSSHGTLTTRIRKVMDEGSPAFLEMTTTVNDPLYYTRPWTVVRRFGWHPYSLREYNCEEQVGDPSVPEQGGLIPEPKD